MAKRSKNCKSDNLAVYKETKIDFEQLFLKLTTEAEAYKYRPLKKSELVANIFSIAIPKIAEAHGIKM